MVISKRKVVTRLGAALTAAALVVPLMSAVAASPASATKVPSISSFPRDETLYTSGSAYSPPSNWNPLDGGSRYTGTMGLLYETLFLYDPIHNKYLPWLATSGSWTGPTTYALQVRNNVKWSNGSALTGNDVAYSINLAKTNPAVPYSNLGQYLSGPGAVASGNTVTVHFTSPAPYAAWQNYLWNQPVLPQSAWSKLSATDQVTGANTSPVSTGPMTLVPGGYNQTEACYQDNPNWWALGAVGPVVPLQIPVRCRERFEQCRTIGAPEQQHRLEQQLLAGHQYPDDHRWQQFHPDVLPVRSLHAVGQYRLA